MHWTMLIGLLLLGTAALVLPGLLLRTTGGAAPGWRIRCTGCDRSVDAARVGVVRIGASSRGSRTLGFCRSCRRLRLLAIERTAPDAAP